MTYSEDIAYVNTCMFNVTHRLMTFTQQGRDLFNIQRTEHRDIFL